MAYLRITLIHSFVSLHESKNLYFKPDYDLSIHFNFIHNLQLHRQKSLFFEYKLSFINFKFE